MNTLFDAIKMTINLLSPYNSNEKKVRETIKSEIESLNIPDFHKTNMKAIIDKAQNANEALANLNSYMMANNLHF